MIADICDAVGADVEQVQRGIGLDPRIGTSFLKAGLGFGGYCLPKDLCALAHVAREHHVEVALLSAVERINQQRVERFLRKIREALWLVQGKTIAVLGLAFKPGTDDMRAASSVAIIEELRRQGARLRVYDPKAMENARRLFGHDDGCITCCDDPYDAASGAHALLILTEWEEFTALELAKLYKLMQVPVIIDGRNLLDPESVRSAGFEYFCMGRNPSRVKVQRVSRGFAYPVANNFAANLAGAA
jgi:UDPglucose 6-dehydrogenase